MVTYPQISNFIHVNHNYQRCLKSENKELFTIVSLFCNKSYMCTQCDLHVTAVYFKRLSTENDCDTDCTELDFSYFNCNETSDGKHS